LVFSRCLKELIITKPCERRSISKTIKTDLDFDRRRVDSLRKFTHRLLLFIAAENLPSLKCRIFRILKRRFLFNCWYGSCL